jgi:hypothetical protein
MNKLLTTLILAASLLSTGAIAASPEDTVVNLFDAMRAHDGEKLLSQFTSAATLQRVKADYSVISSDLNKFAKGISSTSKYLDEQLLSVTTKTSGNLASVWTPYVFYIDKSISHCGVNSFQLVETKSGSWKIQYLIDNVYQGNCEDFIQQHKK